MNNIHKGVFVIACLVTAGCEERKTTVGGGEQRGLNDVEPSVDNLYVGETYQDIYSSNIDGIIDLILSSEDEVLIKGEYEKLLKEDPHFDKPQGVLRGVIDQINFKMKKKAELNDWEIKTAKKMFKLLTYVKSINSNSDLYYMKQGVSSAFAGFNLGMLNEHQLNEFINEALLSYSKFK